MIYSISLGLERYPEYVDGDWDLNKMQPYIRLGCTFRISDGFFIYADIESHLNKN